MSMQNLTMTSTVQITTDGVPKVHCPICNKGLTTLTGYVNHVKKHSPPGGFVCRSCHKSFCSDELLQHHLRTEHLSIKKKTFSSKASADSNDNNEKKQRKGRPRKEGANPEGIATVRESFGSAEQLVNLPVEVDKTEINSSNFQNELNLGEHSVFSIQDIKSENELYDNCLSLPQATEIILVKAEQMDIDNIEETADTDALDLNGFSPTMMDDNMVNNEIDSWPKNSRKLHTNRTGKVSCSLRRSEFMSQQFSEVNSFERDSPPKRPRGRPKRITLALSDVTIKADCFVKRRPGRPRTLDANPLSTPSQTITDQAEITNSPDVHPVIGSDVLSIKEETIDKENTTSDSVSLIITNAPSDLPKPRRRGRPRKDGNYDYIPPPKRKRVSRDTLKLLRERIRAAKGAKPQSWDCVRCQRPFQFRRSYEKHLRNIHEMTDDDIGQVFKGHTNLVAEANDDLHRCRICDKMYVNEWRLETHVKQHGPDGNWVFRCPCLCVRYFPSDKDATEHAQKEHRNQIYCAICDKFLNSRMGLKSHMETTHTKKKIKTEASESGTTTNIEPKKRFVNLVCEKCGKKFRVRTQLNDHVRSDCGRNPFYECNQCGKKLTTAGILKTHMQLHQEETPYSCEKCGKKFKSKETHKSHMKYRHSDEKPFKCHLCPKAYPYRESLFIHMTVHTGIKRFRCDGCNKRFSCISNLQSHRKAQSDSCGLLPLNTKSTQYMGVQKGTLLLGSKPEAGVDFEETNTIVAKDVISHDFPITRHE